jgi:general secretion pathway protein E
VEGARLQLLGVTRRLNLGDRGVMNGPSFTLNPRLSREFLLHYRLCPVGIDDQGHLSVIAAEEWCATALNDIAWLYGREPEVLRVSREDLEHSIERLVTRAERAVELEQSPGGEDLAATDVRTLANEPPVIRYVNLIIRDAHEARASDIHLEGTATGLAARFRIDGVLVPAPEPPAELQQAIVSRIKLIAELDIAERRRSQDGRVRVRVDEREVDIRVSTVPTVHGESVVMRLLDRGVAPPALHELDMPGCVLTGVHAILRRPHGLLLVTGPTGSGKTTTLYAALQARDAATEKIITVEDPVEYQLPGVTQVPVHRQTGVTFASALRSILRQDPDVVMIGEIRDPETAEIGIQAAMTGHLVLATLHTNDAIGALPRLRDLGVPSFLIAATVQGIVAQRLVRRVCVHCASDYEPPREVLSHFKLRHPMPPFRRGRGCPRCRNTGFHGRVGIFELVPLLAPLREAVSRGAESAELRAALHHGPSLLNDGFDKAVTGLTTLEEVLRVSDN